MERKKSGEKKSGEKKKVERRRKKRGETKKKNVERTSTRPDRHHRKLNQIRLREGRCRVQGVWPRNHREQEDYILHHVSAERFGCSELSLQEFGGDDMIENEGSMRWQASKPQERQSPRHRAVGCNWREHKRRREEHR